MKLWSRFIGWLANIWPSPRLSFAKFEQKPEPLNRCQNCEFFEDFRDRLDDGSLDPDDEFGYCTNGEHWDSGEYGGHWTHGESFCMLHRRSATPRPVIYWIPPMTGN